MTSPVGSDEVLAQAHKLAVTTPQWEMVKALVDAFGTTLVAYMADVRSRQMPLRWMMPPDFLKAAKPGDEAVRRLLIAFTALTAIRESDDMAVARAWMIGSNPRFDGGSPAERVRADDAAAVFAAVSGFLQSEFS